MHWAYMRLLQIILFTIFSFFGRSQHLQLLHSGGTVSIRGLSVVSDRILWVSGSEGTVGLSTNGGTNWKWIRVPHYEKADFRDIEAFSDQDAIVMGITEPAVVLLTKDGGNSWKTVFEDTSKTAFLDAMDFSGVHAAVVGDPLRNQIYFAESTDRGERWITVSPSAFMPTADGESFFAASGSNIQHFQDGSWVFVSGGKKSCIYFGKSRIPLLLNQGKETTGANSIAVNPANNNQAFVVGGDFKHDTAQTGNSLLIQINPFKQKSPIVPPHGYRSCVEYINGKEMICCGTSGVDISNDGGLHWQLISNMSFHVCRKSKTGNAVFLAGSQGKIAIWQSGF
jgi:photosystem II stability/assembly factor-like uncharacterized protein